MRMKSINTLILVIGILGCLVHAVPAQTAANPKEPPKTEEEPKGEVDLLLEDLKSHGEAVLRRCLEKCPESAITDGTKVSVGESVNKVQPAYPALARAAHVAGEVVVMLVIDEEGKVIAAQVFSGHPLLRAACIKAAKESTFTRTLIEQKHVKVLGTITYNFVAN
jgi:TonB family protein